MRIRDVFHEVADLSVNARGRWFDEQPVGPETRREVEELLAFDAGGGPTIERRIGQMAAVALTTIEHGGRCGPYRLGELIGRGGMGTVYSAERVDGEVTRRVAIKLLPPGGGSATARERFLGERQIMASLQHPGIAALLDAGHTSDGRPYLVMDYIDGVPIDVYGRDLPVHETLELFVRVCDAVSYAHQNLVVHRDIKPSNILVDRSGQPKLLDFGIAKLLENEDTLLTREGAVVLTPAYAAPEQVSGGRITAATDVYALGILLFVLLTGRHPAGAAPQSMAEACKAVLEIEPGRVTAAIPRDRLRGPFRGDLDTVVAKALKKNPGDRYVSVAELADDVRRYLEHQPVKARPDSWAYRGSKLLCRHRTPIAFALLAVLASVAGIFGTWRQAREARAQRDFALRQLARAEAINDLNAYVLSDAAPSGHLFSVDDLLARSERIVRRQNGPDTSTRIDLLISIGRQYTVQDEYAKARSLLEEAYQLSRGVSDGSARGRSACALGQTLSRTGDLGRAESLFQEGIRAIPGRPLEALDRIFCLERGAEIALNGGDSGTAVARAQAARSLVKELPVPSELAELNTLITLAGAESAAGQFERAASDFGQAAARLAELGRADTQRSGTVFNNWGVVLIRAGRPREAREVLRRSIEISRTGESDDSVQAMPLVNYARVLFDLNELGEAREYAEKGVAKARQAGDEAPARDGLILLAGIYRAQGDLRRAERTVSEAAQRFAASLPAGHGMFAGLALERAAEAEAAGDLAGAWKQANQAVSIAEDSAKLRGAHRLPRFLIYRSGVALRLGRVKEAEADAVRAIGILREGRETGSRSADLGRGYLAFGRALEARGAAVEAREAFRMAAEQLGAALGPDHPDTRAAAQRAT